MVKLKTILDIRRAKSDGTYPIMFRVTNHKEVKYITYGISVLKQHWDEKAGNLKKNHPNASTLKAQISKRYYEIQKAIVKLEDESCYSFNALKIAFHRVLSNAHYLHFNLNSLLAFRYLQVWKTHVLSTIYCKKLMVLARTYWTLYHKNMLN